MLKVISSESETNVVYSNGSIITKIEYKHIKWLSYMFIFTLSGKTYEIKYKGSLRIHFDLIYDKKIIANADIVDYILWRTITLTHGQVKYKIKICHFRFKYLLMYKESIIGNLSFKGSEFGWGIDLFADIPNDISMEIKIFMLTIILYDIRQIKLNPCC